MKILKVAAAAGVLFCAVSAQAKPYSIWVQCDGYAKPENGGVKLVKGLAAIGTLGLFGIPETYSAEGRARGEAGVAACTQALADPAARNAGWLRRVTLNQALAIHNLEAKKPADALAAIETAEAAAGANAANPFYARSTAVSLKLLRSAALLGLDRDEEAVAAALAAAEARPHSARVQSFATVLANLDRKARPEEMIVARRLLALDPGSSDLLAGPLIEGRQYGEAWRLLKPKWQYDRNAPANENLTLSSDAIASALTAAFVAARTGDAAGVNGIVDGYTADIQATAARMTKALPKSVRPMTNFDQLARGPFDALRPTLDAALLLAAGDAHAARDKLAAKGLPKSVVLLDLMIDIRDALPPAERTGLYSADLDTARARLQESRKSKIDRIAGVALFAILPEPEDENKLNAYSSQAGWGFKKTGFKARKLDNGDTNVEFIGSISSPLVVEEMTLLRAAELATKAGRVGFTIEKRTEYNRYRQMTMNGQPVGSRIPAGYKTEFQIRFVDDLGAPAAHDAKAVYAALGPVYIREKNKAR